MSYMPLEVTEAHLQLSLQLAICHQQSRQKQSCAVGSILAFPTSLFWRHHRLGCLLTCIWLRIRQGIYLGSRYKAC